MYSGVLLVFSLKGNGLVEDWVLFHTSFVFVLRHWRVSGFPEGEIHVAATVLVGSVCHVRRSPVSFVLLGGVLGVRLHRQIKMVIRLRLIRRFCFGFFLLEAPLVVFILGNARK